VTLHLVLQSAVRVLDVDSTGHEALVGFNSQPIPLVFGNHQAQCALYGFSFGTGA
jgi:hypothetical protein